MALPVALSQWQMGYIFFGLIACCLFLITTLHIGLVGNQRKFRRVFGYGLILICSGISAILLNKQFIMHHESGVFSVIMSATFGVMLVAWGMTIFISAKFFVRRWNIITNTKSGIQKVITTMPVICTMILVVWAGNYNNIGLQSVLLREVLFVIIGTIITIIVVCQLLYRIVQ